MSVLIPADELRWTRYDSFLPLRTNQQGAFKVTGAPGEYLLLPPLRERPSEPLEYIRAAATKGIRVILKQGRPCSR